MDEKKFRNTIMVLAQQNAMLYYQQLITMGTSSDQAEYQALDFVLNVVAQYEDTNIEALSEELRDEAMNRTRYVIHHHYPNRDNPSN